ncbi:hypothetical protein YTPLAS18_36110 [Nitrospira sp.]|nr:hypothetical protein YTPLAS18_36110 [Nitrospira sp.]
MADSVSSEDLRARIVALLTTIAPEADGQTLMPNVNLRDQLDLDSMDFLNFVVAIHKEFHMEIPEVDYPKLSTLDGCVAYVAEHGDGASSQ